jgi:Coenzyme PQQ synthesis protein D (PqqD)
VIDGAFVPRARASIASVEVDGEGVLFDEATGAMHLLSPTATVLFACFDGTGTIDEIVADLAEVYAAPVDVVRADVIEATGRMAEQGLLEGVGPEPDAAPTEEPVAGPRFLEEPPGG